MYMRGVRHRMREVAVIRRSSARTATQPTVVNHSNCNAMCTTQSAYINALWVAGVSFFTTSSAYSVPNNQACDIDNATCVQVQLQIRLVK